MRCRLCFNPDVRHVERRYSGWSGEQLRPWFYCAECFQELRRGAAARYALFLERRAGRFQRRISRIQA